MIAGKLNRRIVIQSETSVQDSTFGTWTNTWGTFATVWAEVQDVLPSRSERVADSINIAKRPSRIRMRYRSDITSDMRVKIGSRILQIVAGPAELGNRDGIEIIAEEMTTAGEPA